MEVDLLLGLHNLKILKPSQNSFKNWFFLGEPSNKSSKILRRWLSFLELNSTPKTSRSAEMFGFLTNPLEVDFSWRTSHLQKPSELVIFPRRGTGIAGGPSRARAAGAAGVADGQAAPVMHEGRARLGALMGFCSVFGVFFYVLALLKCLFRDNFFNFFLSNSKFRGLNILNLKLQRS